MQAGWGEQFSGSNFFLNLSHRHRRSVWTAAFSESISTDRDRQIARQVAPVVDEFGEPIEDPIDQEILSSTESNSLNDDTQVFIRLSSTYAYRSRRNRLSLSLVHENRSFQLGDFDETVFGAGARFTRQLSKQTKARFRTAWRFHEFQGGSRTDSTWRSSVSLTHSISDSLRGSVNYAYNVKFSDDPGREFTENRLSASLNVSF